MTKDALNHDIRNAEMIEIGSKAAPASVPAVPFGELIVALVFVIGFRVIAFGLAANFAPVERGTNLPA